MSHWLRNTVVSSAVPSGLNILPSQAPVRSFATRGVPGLGGLALSRRFWRSFRPFLFDGLTEASGQGFRLLRIPEPRDRMADRRKALGVSLDHGTFPISHLATPEPICLLIPMLPRL